MEINNRPQPKIQSFNIDYQINRLDTRENREATTKKDPWIHWGIKNDYPQFLLQVKEHSPVMSVSIDAKTNMSVGDGVEIEGLGNVMVNRYETISELYYKCLYDVWLFGGFSLETIKNRTGDAVESIYHLPFQNVRVGKGEDDTHTSEIDNFYYCENWQDAYQKRIITKFHGINMEARDAREIYYWKSYSPTTNRHYPITPYQSGLDACVLEAEIFDWHKRNLASSLVPNLFVSLIGDPSPEEKMETFQELLQSYQGKHGQKIMLSFSNSAEDRPIIEPIANNANDGLYLEVLNMCVQSILTAQQISSPLLLGISTFGSNPFSQNSDELIVAWKHMLEVVIKPMVKKVNMGLETILALKYNRPVKIINNFRIPEL